MREIKFRAWDKADKKYIYDIYPATDGDMAGMYNGRYCLRLPSERVIIEQFTGLKDKNGVEIYEGDRIKFDTGIITTVEWLEELYCFSFNVCSMVCDQEEGCVRDGKVEVIGNIHDKK